MKTYVHFYAYLKHNTLNICHEWKIFQEKKKRNTIHVKYTFSRSLTVFKINKMEAMHTFPNYSNCDFRLSVPVFPFISTDNWEHTTLKNSIKMSYIKQAKRFHHDIVFSRNKPIFFWSLHQTIVYRIKTVNVIYSAAPLQYLND